MTLTLKTLAVPLLITPTELLKLRPRPLTFSRTRPGHELAFDRLRRHLCARIHRR